MVQTWTNGTDIKIMVFTLAYGRDYILWYSILIIQEVQVLPLWRIFIVAFQIQPLMTVWQ